MKLEFDILKYIVQNTQNNELISKLLYHNCVNSQNQMFSLKKKTQIGLNVDSK